VGTPGGRTVKTVLMIEDDPGIRDAMRIYFEAAGYRFSAVESAETALAEFGRQGYDIIISDYKLPGMNGLEFLRKIRGRHPGSAKVFTTSYGSSDLFEEARRLGAACCIEKPLSAEKIEACLAMLWRPTNAPGTKRD